MFCFLESLTTFRLSLILSEIVSAQNHFNSASGNIEALRHSPYVWRISTVAVEIIFKISCCTLNRGKKYEEGTPLLS